MPEKRVPMRRCVGCNSSRPKRELDRYVFFVDEYVFDETGNRDGRGTYVCRDSASCLNKAQKRKHTNFRREQK